MSGIEVVVWDMGGVFQCYFTENVLSVGRQRGWPVDSLPMGPTGGVPDPDYDAMDAGEIDEGEYYQRVVARLRAAGIDYEPRADRGNQNRTRPEVWALLEDIAASPLRQAVLTNDGSKWLGTRWWETWPHRHLFDAIVDVEQVGVRKPAPEPFRHVLEVLGADANASLFVDDMRVNCRGAEAVGMRSHRLDIAHPADSVAALRTLLDLDRWVTR